MSSPLAIPPELKKISPYVRRAEELDKDSTPESRLVSYYCRQYAVHLGIPLSGSSPGAKVCLGHLLENLEAEKKAMDNFTRDEAAFLCRKFANKVFDKANGEDRMGLANKNTAKTFYAASTFLQILEQFSDEGDVSDEREEDRKRIVYAKWKSTEILKAIKDGRTPTPGGYGEDEDGDDAAEEDEPEKKVDAPTTSAVVETVESDEEEEVVFPIKMPAPMLPPAPVPPPVSMFNQEEPEDEEPEEEGTEIGLGPPPAYPGALNGGGGGINVPTNRAVDRPKITFEPQPPVVPPPPPPAAAAVQPPKQQQRSGGLFGFGKKKPDNKASKAQLADALELAKFALAALEDKDADLGAERLQQALEALGR